MVAKVCNQRKWRGGGIKASPVGERLGRGSLAFGVKSQAFFCFFRLHDVHGKIKYYPPLNIFFLLKIMSLTQLMPQACTTVTPYHTLLLQEIRGALL